MSQLLRASRAAGADEKQQRQVLDEMAAAIPGLSLTMRPPEIAQLGHRIVRRITGNSDPYRKDRDEANRAALSYYPSLKESLAAAADPLLAACKLAIAGNAIDLGPRATTPAISTVIAGALTAPLAVDDYAEFKQSAGQKISSTWGIMPEKSSSTGCSSRKYATTATRKSTSWCGANRSSMTPSRRTLMTAG